MIFDFGQYDFEWISKPYPFFIVLNFLKKSKLIPQAKVKTPAFYYI